ASVPQAACGLALALSRKRLGEQSLSELARSDQPARNDQSTRGPSHREPALFLKGRNSKPFALVGSTAASDAARSAALVPSRPAFDLLEDRLAPATSVWSGASLATSNWNDPVNWVGSTAPRAGDDLVFPGGAARLVTTNNFPANVTFHSFTIAGGGYTLS